MIEEEEENQEDENKIHEYYIKKYFDAEIFQNYLKQWGFRLYLNPWDLNLCKGTGFPTH